MGRPLARATLSVPADADQEVVNGVVVRHPLLHVRVRVCLTGAPRVVDGQARRGGGHVLGAARGSLSPCLMGHVVLPIRVVVGSGPPAAAGRRLTYRVVTVCPPSLLPPLNAGRTQADYQLVGRRLR